MKCSRLSLKTLDEQHNLYIYFVNLPAPPAPPTLTITMTVIYQTYKSPMIRNSVSYFKYLYRLLFNSNR